MRPHIKAKGQLTNVEFREHLTHKEDLDAIDRQTDRQTCLWTTVLIDKAVSPALYRSYRVLQQKVHFRPSRFTVTGKRAPSFEGQANPPFKLKTATLISQAFALLKLLKLLWEREGKLHSWLCRHYFISIHTSLARREWCLVTGGPSEKPETRWSLPCLSWLYWVGT